MLGYRLETDGGARRRVAGRIERSALHHRWRRRRCAGCDRRGRWLRLGRRERFGGRAEARERQIAVAFGPVEDLTNRLFRNLPGQLERPGEVTVLGVDVAQRRQLLRVELHLQLGELGELAQHAQRIVAPRQQLTVGTKAHLPSGRGRRDRRLRRRRRGCGGRGGLGLADDGHLQIELQVRHALRVDGLLGLDGAQHGAQHVHGLQQQVGHRRRDRHAAAAQLIEQRLEAVGEGGDLAEAERGAAAFDRVRDAEYGVDQFRIRGADVELQQRRLHGVERLEALLEERVVELGQVDGHRSAPLSESIASMPSRRAADSMAGEQARQ